MEKTIKMIEAHLALWIEMVATMFVGEVDYYGSVQITREGRTISLKLVSETGMKLATNSLTWWAGNSANWIAHDLWIHPELRGTGFVKIIRAWQKRVFKDMCAEHIYCTVRADNPAGLKAAVKAGYKATGTTGHGSDGCVCFHKTTAHHAWINRPNC